MSSAQIATTDELSRGVNVAGRLAQIAQQMPDAVAVACPGRGDVAGRNTYATCTFRELDRDATTLARGFAELGVQPGARLVLLVPPGVAFVKLVFALLRCGATTVLVDPGMGRRHLLKCLAAVEPEGFVAVSAAQAVRTMLRHRFPQARKNVTLGHRWYWGGKTYEQLLRLGRQSKAKLPATRADDPAAIIFTSGSTGPPKGVLYTHRMFVTQAEEIRTHYGIHPGGADLACFALFGLFNSAMGVTTVFPRMDFSRPASADPRQLLASAHDWRVTQAFASPAVWRNLSQYCAQHNERIPTLCKVFSCGAPVPADVLRQTLACVQPAAAMHTPYGATESLPVATISAEEVLRETASETDRGAGICVGRKFDTIEWRVIRITDEPIASIDKAEEMPLGEIGELIVRGPQVSPAYVTGGEQHDALAKIQDGDTIWHRLGDVGYLDDQGRFWYCGRKSHRVTTRDRTLFTIPCEAMFNTHPEVARSAVVGIGPPVDQCPLVVIEPAAGMQRRLGKNWAHPEYERFRAELLELASRHDITKSICMLFFHPSLPVDVRHNAKINREQLAKWAAEQLAMHSSFPCSAWERAKIVGTRD
jgi:acyl-CoA synthetase (AMP-forming)/AMP-acid ligase II